MSFLERLAELQLKRKVAAMESEVHQWRRKMDAEEKRSMRFWDQVVEKQKTMEKVLLKKFPKIAAPSTASRHRLAFPRTILFEVFGRKANRGSCDDCIIANILESRGIEKTKAGYYKIPV